MAGLWERFGFRQNPYFATPIEMTAEGLDLFVGRGAEVRRLLSKWDEPEGCITVIGGNIGTGKTSFLNVCQYLCLHGKRDFQLPFDPPHLLPSFVRTQLEQELSQVDLLLRVIRALCHSAQQASADTGAPMSAVVIETLRWLDSLTASEDSSLEVGGGVPVFSATVAKSSGYSYRNPGEFSADALIMRITHIAKQLRESAGFRGAIIAIDNIEMVASDRVIELLNRYRDTLFSIPGLWWVLIGQQGLYDLIQASAPRVSQRIKGTETTLAGLSWHDFELAIEARIDHFKLRPDAVAPIGSTMLNQLFTASAGEIRYVFKMADEIVTDALAEDPNLRSVPPEMAETILRESVRRQLDNLALSSREQRVLAMLCSNPDGARPKEYKEFGFQNAPNFIQGALQPLQDMGLVAKSTQANAATYKPRSLALLAFQFGFLPKVSSPAPA